MNSNIIESIGLGVFNLLKSKPAAPVSLSFMARFIYWASLLTPLLQILGNLLVWRKRQSMKAWGVILTVILNLAVVFLLYRLSLQIITLPSLLLYFPELGYGLIAIAALGIGWSVVYTVMFLMKRRAT